MKNKIYITGIGVISSLGNSAGDFFSSIKNQKENISDNLNPYFKREAKISQGTFVKNFDPEIFIDPMKSRRMDGFIQFGFSSVTQAMKDAGIENDLIIKKDAAFIFNTTYGPFNTSYEYLETLFTKGPGKVLSSQFSNSVVNALNGHVAMHYGTKGNNTMLVSTSPIEYAFSLLGSGQVDMAIVTGTEQLSDSIADVFEIFVSKNEKKFNKISAFDKNYSTGIFGDGSVTLVLETEKSALARNSRKYCEIGDPATRYDRQLNYNLCELSNDGELLQSAMKESLTYFNFTEHDIDLICSATNSFAGMNYSEAAAIKNLFKQKSVPITSSKSYLGETLGASELFNVLWAIFVIKEQTIPCINNLSDPIDNSLDLVKGRHRNCPINNILLNSFYFGGAVSSVVCRKP